MRGHGEGTILTRKRRRKDGSVAVRYVVVASKPDGTKVSRWFETRKAAEDERKRLADLRAVGRLDAARLTLGAYLRRWASDMDLAPATMKQHRNIIDNHLIPRLGDVLLGRLQPLEATIGFEPMHRGFADVSRHLDGVPIVLINVSLRPPAGTVLVCRLVCA